LGGVANGVLPSHSDHLDLDEPQPLAHTLPSNRPGANDDADDDVQCWLRPSGPRNPCAVHARMPWNDLTAIFSTTPPSFSAPTRVGYRCGFESRWLTADLVEKVKMGHVRIQGYESELRDKRDVSEH
jgi:hypothetical protein